MPSSPADDRSRQAAARSTPQSAAEAETDPNKTSNEPPELALKQVGEFRITRRLGRGGMSDVYLAEQTSLHRSVAIKVLRPELLSDATILKRFEQEAKAAAGLIHPNIVQVYSFGQQDGIHYIAQEYVQGMNLRQFLNRKGPPELRVAYVVMRQIAAALAVAGDAGIVHRDIKPENILMTRKGEAKVADFGLAQLAESEQRVQLTQVGMTMGTPLYMSPEQISGEEVDHRSDIYSFGVTCYRMLAGRPPFSGETSLTLAMQHLTKTAEPLSSLRSDLPPILCEIVHKMMARNPDDRYQHANEITQDLKRFARTLKVDPDVTEAIPLSTTTSTKRPENWREAFFFWSLPRHVLLFSVVALLMGSASAGIGWLLRAKNPLDAPAVRQDTIPRKGSAKEQFESAQQLGSDEGAWRAVLDYFPDDRTYGAEAKERLAILYLKSRRLDEAKKLFADLEGMGRENPNAKAVGIAGRAVIASLDGDYKTSQRLIVADLGDLSRRREQLTSDLWFLLRRAGRENGQHLGEEAQKQLKELFDDE